jgi:hypothetical protein
MNVMNNNNVKIVKFYKMAIFEIDFWIPHSFPIFDWFPVLFGRLLNEEWIQYGWKSKKFEKCPQNRKSLINKERDFS